MALYRLSSVLCLLFVSRARAYDAIVWSVGQSAASADDFVYEDAIGAKSTPLVIFRIDDFDLVKFNLFANVYSGSGETASTSRIKEHMRASSGYDAKWLGNNPLILPTDAVKYGGGNDALFGTIVVRVKDLHEADRLLDDVVSGLRSYTVLLANTGAFTEQHKRNKRQSGTDADATDAADAKDAADATDAADAAKPDAGDDQIVPPDVELGAAAPALVEDLADAVGEDGKMPLAVYATEKEPCSLYIDTVRLLIKNPQCAKGQPASCPPKLAKEKSVYGQDFGKGDDVEVLKKECEEESAIFQIKVSDSEQAFTELTFTLAFSMRQDWYWKLSNMSIDDVKAKNEQYLVGAPGAVSGAANIMSAYSVKGFCYGCGQTESMWSGETKECGNKDLCRYGLQFSLIKAEPFQAPKGAFSDQMDDCQSLFDAPMWMGLLVGLFIAGVLVFALSMINALQVMDRFDDPRGKPLQINVKGE